MHDLVHVEVAIPNSYDYAFSTRWSGSRSWLLDPCSPVQEKLEHKRRGGLVDVNARNRASISEAVTRTHSTTTMGRSHCRAAVWFLAALNGCGSREDDLSALTKSSIP